MLTFTAMLAATKHMGSYGEGHHRFGRTTRRHVDAAVNATDPKPSDVIRRWDEVKCEFVYVRRGGTDAGQLGIATKHHEVGSDAR